MAYYGEKAAAGSEMKRAAEPEWEAFWEARQQFHRAVDLAENARNLTGGAAVSRAVLAIAKDRARDLMNTLMVLEQQACAAELREQAPPETW